MASKDEESKDKKRDGYWDAVLWSGGTPAEMRIGLKGTWTGFSSQAPDEYGLELRPMADQIIHYTTFQFKQFEGRGRRITLSMLGVFPGGRVIDESQESIIVKAKWINETKSRTTSADGQVGLAEFTDRLASIRHIEVNTDLTGELVAALSVLRADGLTWEHLVEDARQVLPHLAGIDVEDPSGGAVSVVLHERGLRHPTPLAKASDGTVRLLRLLATLHDPRPPALTCIDEIDRGIHPQAAELLVERIREASERTQFLITTHSPAFVDRLRPEELIVCKRGDDGASIIPAVGHL